MKNLICKSLAVVLVLFLFSLEANAQAVMADHTINVGTVKYKSTGESLVVTMATISGLDCRSFTIEGFKSKKSKLSEAAILFRFCDVDLSAVAVDTELTFNRDLTDPTTTVMAGEVSVGVNQFATNGASATVKTSSFESKSAVDGKLRVTKVEGDNVTFFYNLRFTTLDSESIFPHLNVGKSKANKKVMRVTGKFIGTKTDLSI